MKFGNLKKKWHLKTLEHKYWLHLEYDRLSVYEGNKKL